MSTNESFLPVTLETSLENGALATLKRNKGKFLLVLVIGIGLTLAFFSTVGRQYRSTSKLFVKMGRESMVLDPTAQTKFSTTTNSSKEIEVFAVAELMKSRGVVEKVVDHFGPRVILEKQPNKKSLGEHLAFLNEANLNPLRVYSERDKAIKAFMQNMGVAAGKKTNVVSVQYDSESPQLAKDVLDFWVQLSINEHLRIHKTQGSEEYFVDKVESSEKTVNELEAELRDLKTSSGLAALEKQRSILLDTMGELKRTLLRNRAIEKSTQVGLDERNASLKNIPEMITIEQSSDQAQAVGQSLREQLLALEVQEQDLRSRFSESHPRVKTIRKQIDEVRQIVEKENVAKETKTGINRLYQDRQAEILQYSAKLVEVQAENKMTKESLETLTKQLEAINNTEQTLTKLEMEIELAKVDYKTYRENLEQARINNELEEKKITSLNLMEAPTFVETPVFPSPFVTLGAGGILSLISAFGVAVFFDRRKQYRSIVASQRQTSPAPTRAGELTDDRRIDGSNSSNGDDAFANGAEHANGHSTDDSVPQPVATQAEELSTNGASSRESSIRRTPR